MTNYKHWELYRDKESILWLGLNRKDKALNSIDEEVLDELNKVVQDLSEDKSALGVVIYSLKDKGFIAGADISVFSKFENPEQAVGFLQKGHAVFAKLQALSIPSLAMIDGFCMGGGLELALACTYRIASDEVHTRIGLPEVLLGIHPGWGGTVRLPQLIGGFKALAEVMLTGSALAAGKAKALGVVDEVVPLRQLKRTATFFIKNKPSKHKPSFIQSLTNSVIFRKPIALLLRQQVAKKVRKQHYPAPYALIDLWEKEGACAETAYSKEIKSVKELISKGETSKNLIRAFLLRERLKSFAKDNPFKATRVHVIGAGVMGGDIAAFCALRGIHVTLEDKSYEQIAPAIGRAQVLFQKKLRKPRLIQAAMDKLIADPEGHGVKHADVIIEAVFENLKVKQELIKRIEQIVPEHAIIATNTSSIPLEEISSVMTHPERLVGIHFFNPVAKMDLVEIVSSTLTSKEVQQNSCAFVSQIGKLPLPVSSSPGFLINRILMPYLMECVQLLEEGYSGETIDEAALQFGMFMGPVELADTVGMDVCLAVAENLTSHFGGTLPNKLAEMVKAGTLGRKSGKGFYVYKKGKPVKNKPTLPIESSIADRLILRIINESAACLREGVVADADLLDAGMIFATGFAPFRGGPMTYAKDFGKDKLEHLFKTFESKYGARFKVDESL